jgi:cytochrome d ubiquinol oxidase subunit II
MLAGAAAAIYPNLLPASGDSALSITIFSAAAGRHALAVGLIWWSAGILLAIGYFVFVYRMARGKVD